MSARATGPDPFDFGRLGPDEVVEYLRDRGWREEKRIRGGQGSVWVSTSNRRVLVPLDESLRDYEANVAQLISDLSVFECRSIERVYNAMCSTLTEVLIGRITDGFEEGDGSEIEGVVIRIERVHQDAGPREEVSGVRTSKGGIVTISGGVGDRPSQVRMVLCGDDYARAIAAFGTNEVLRVFVEVDR